MSKALALIGIAALGVYAQAVELTLADFDAEVKESGKNSIVKFFAPWCGHCKAMKPAFDKLAEEYATSSSVNIVDVDCTKEEKLCSDNGVKGYPTIKYYKDGDKEGKPYNSGRDFDGLKKFVEDELEVKCLVGDTSKCSDKEKQFIDKMKAAGKADVEAQLKRLSGMTGDKMKSDLKKWLHQRLAILKQLEREL